MLRLVPGLCAALLSAAAWAQAPPALLRLEHAVFIEPAPVQGAVPQELSALAWDAAAAELVAASDRGWLFRFGLQERRGRLEVAARAAQRIEAGRDVEALHMRVPGAGSAPELWMLAETAGTAVQLGPRGERLDSRPWPSPLGPNTAAEAMAWQHDTGLLVAPQRAPRQAAAAALHVVHADGTRWWAFEPRAARSHIKAIEALDEQHLLVLERVELARTAGAPRQFRTVLRLIAQAGCGQARTCEAPEVPVVPALPDGPDNFEGLACAADGRCWLVSDSGPGQGTPTRLLQLRLERR